MTEKYLALYRKYRPESFDDVVGQEQIVTLLTEAIKKKTISHAYLFCGGRGTGKTTVARIFARDIGCNPEDIIEIDAASNRGIDEVRILREAVLTAPFTSPYKVYIIDEAHMLTKDAANALLKTLEEPPSHVIFILATTDPDKLPATIVSRCQKVQFKQPDIETLKSRLIHVATKEGKTLSDDSALLIAGHGKGSYRDALGVLEQVLTISGKTVKHDDILSHLGTPSGDVLVALLEAVCSKNIQSALASINTLKFGNANALQSYDAFIELARLALLSRIVQSTPADEEIRHIGKTYALVINSKLILELLEKRALLLASHAHAWIAFEAVAISLVEN